MSKLTFNDHLDDMMERLMAEDLSTEQLENELKRGKALCQIAAVKIEDKKVGVKFMELVSNGLISEKLIPPALLPEFKQLPANP